MTASTPPRFAIPDEMRAVAERSVDLAELALNDYLRATYQAVAIGDPASPIGAQDFDEKAVNFAERNVLSALEICSENHPSQGSPGNHSVAHRIPSVANANSHRTGERPG